jgi:Skp family chaperone for outer membrane proteins
MTADERKQNMNRIKAIAIILTLFLALTAGATLQAQDKVGVFNAQLISENTEIGKGIQETLNAFTEVKEADITSRQTVIQDLRQQLSTQALSLSADRRAELEKDIQLRMLDLQSFQEAATRELELEYNSATKDFQEKLAVAVETFGTDEGFAVLFDRSQVAWVDNGIDVTSAHVDRFNKMFPAAAGE